MKKGNLKRQHLIRFQLYDILERQVCETGNISSGCQRLLEWGREARDESRQKFRALEIFCIYCNDRYTPLYICSLYGIQLSKEMNWVLKTMDWVMMC